MKKEVELSCLENVVCEIVAFILTCVLAIVLICSLLYCWQSREIKEYNRLTGETLTFSEGLDRSSISNKYELIEKYKERTPIQAKGN